MKKLYLALIIGMFFLIGFGASKAIFGGGIIDMSKQEISLPDEKISTIQEKAQVDGISPDISPITCDYDMGQTAIQDLSTDQIEKAQCHSMVYQEDVIQYPWGYNQFYCSENAPVIYSNGNLTISGGECISWTEYSPEDLQQKLSDAVTQKLADYAISIDNENMKTPVEKTAEGKLDYGGQPIERLPPIKLPPSGLG